MRDYLNVSKKNFENWWSELCGWL